MSSKKTKTSVRGRHSKAIQSSGAGRALPAGHRRSDSRSAGSYYRLNRFLAACGVGSRRACDVLISEGRVDVNGEVCATPGRSVDPAKDLVRCDGERKKLPSRWVYLLMNKPSGYISTRSDEMGRRTVDDLLGKSRGDVVPVGRLDQGSEGLLIFTNNGELVNRLLHPRFRHPRTYLVWVSPPPTSQILDQIREGVQIGYREFSGPAEAKIQGRKRGVGRVRITLREGKNREVRRIFKAFGIRVTALRRVSYAGIELGELASGSVRPLTGAEVAHLAAETGLKL